MASFNTIDEDYDDTFVYEFSGVDDATDNDFFVIDGDQLKIVDHPNHETKDSYSIRIQTIDSYGLTYEKSFVLSVNDLDENFGDSNADGFVDGSFYYKLFLEDDNAIYLTNRRGHKISHKSSKKWDAVKAANTNSGFEVLLQGAKRLEDMFYVWTTNEFGVITRGSGWKTADQMMQLGYEEIFDIDINEDGVTELPLQDGDSDGFVDNSSNYKLFYDEGTAIELTRRNGKKLSDNTSKNWNAIKAEKTDFGFQVLLDGSGRLEDMFYVWTTNEFGVITRGSGWKTADQMMQLGYEEIFDMDINEDGLTGLPLEDDDSDGFVDDSSNYKLLHEGNAIDLTMNNGRKLSDNSSSVWDAVKAIKTNSGFEVLLDGSGPVEDKFYVWTTNDFGVITQGSGWKTADQMMMLGYQEKFDFTFNDNQEVFK